MAWFTGFEDRVVVVTGASSGIGRQTAVAFAAAGAKVALLARRREVLEEVAREIHAAGGKALVVPTDVTRRTEVKNAFDTIRRRLRRIDVVVNNAGVLLAAPVTEMTGAELTKMLQPNLYGALYVMQQAVRVMREQEDGGCIVNLASLAGRRGVHPLGGYCASKFALIGLTEALRNELDGTPVHVAMVEPGVTDTPMVEAVANNPDFTAMWPRVFQLPPSWVVWAIFAAARFRLREISVPPGAGTLEKLASLAPGASDAVVRWVTRAGRLVSDLTDGRDRATG